VGTRKPRTLAGSSFPSPESCLAARRAGRKSTGEVLDPALIGMEIVGAGYWANLKTGCKCLTHSAWGCWVDWTCG